MIISKTLHKQIIYINQTMNVINENKTNFGA